MSKIYYSGIVTICLDVTIDYDQISFMSFDIDCSGYVDIASDGDPCTSSEQFDAEPLPPENEFFTDKFLEKLRLMALNHFTSHLEDYEQ